ncbi:hypothetical protein BJ166DRAFT_511556, partial [Pestalotiopsis sp. NC0098]
MLGCWWASLSSRAIRNALHLLPFSLLALSSRLSSTMGLWGPTSTSLPPGSPGPLCCAVPSLDLHPDAWRIDAVPRSSNFSGTYLSILLFSLRILFLAFSYPHKRVGKRYSLQAAIFVSVI